MKRKIKIIGIVGIVLFVLYSLLSLTGIFKAFKSATSANEPNLKANSLLFVSNLVTPKNGNFVCYKFDDKIFGKQIRVHKLCGMENEIIEIKDGVLYLNGINSDKNCNHIHFYEITTEEYNNIKIKENLAEDNYPHQLSLNTIKIMLEDKIVEKYGLTAKRLIDEKGKEEPFITTVFHQKWNKDNFGPIKIPKGKVFVLGDNRDNSMDSRYIGFINQSDIVGVVINK